MVALSRPALLRAALAAALSGSAPVVLSPLPAAAAANEGALGATCAGFGCNNYFNTDFNGLSAADAPAGSLPYADFLKLIKEKKVESVEFIQPNGDEAYAFVSEGGGEGVPPPLPCPPTHPPTTSRRRTP